MIDFWWLPWQIGYIYTKHALRASEEVVAIFFGRRSEGTVVYPNVASWKVPPAA